MPDREADALVVHVHRGQQGAGGHAGLLPARAVVVGDEDVTTLAHHHQPQADRRPVEQQGFDRQRGLHRGERLGSARAACNQDRNRPGQRQEPAPAPCEGGARGGSQNSLTRATISPPTAI